MQADRLRPAIHDKAVSTTVAEGCIDEEELFMISQIGNALV
jgi:hypothetical protein